MVTVQAEDMLEYITGTERMLHKLAQMLLEIMVAGFLEFTLI